MPWLHSGCTAKRHPHGPSYLPINRMTLDLMIVHKTKFFPSTRIHLSLLVSEKDHEKDKRTRPKGHGQKDRQKDRVNRPIVVIGERSASVEEVPVSGSGDVLYSTFFFRTHSQ